MDPGEVILGALFLLAANQAENKATMDNGEPSAHLILL
jgi:hypothetical protein